MWLSSTNYSSHATWQPVANCPEDSPKQTPGIFMKQILKNDFPLGVVIFQSKVCLNYSSGPHDMIVQDTEHNTRLLWKKQKKTRQNSSNTDLWRLSGEELVNFCVWLKLIMFKRKRLLRNVSRTQKQTTERDRKVRFNDKDDKSNTHSED